jgi:glyoxylase-like metal-dependent hydrolase (beta-lactamase superfamily II)
MHHLTRREMLRWTGLGGLLALAPRSFAAAESGAAAGAHPTDANASSYRFRIGDFEAVSIVTGFLDIMPDRPPGLAAEAFEAAVAELDYRAPLRLPYNVLLLRRGPETILIDSGPGPKPSTPYDLHTSLRRHGVTPDSVTHVFLTHAHFDHLGGLIDDHDRVVFPRAEHFCLAPEIEFWTAPKPDFSKLRLNPEGMLALARRVFAAVPFTRLSSTTPLPDGITPILSPGHTPGHMTLEIQSKGETLYHISDLSHHAALLAHPEWPVISDTVPEQAIATRQRIFATLADRGTRTFGFHLPFPGLGRLKRQGTGFRWVPERWDVG